MEQTYPIGGDRARNPFSPQLSPVAGAGATTTEAASQRLKEAWEEGKQKARDLGRKAGESFDTLSHDVDTYVEARPKATALGTLGVGLLLGVVVGLMIERSRA